MRYAIIAFVSLISGLTFAQAVPSSEPPLEEQAQRPLPPSQSSRPAPVGVTGPVRLAVTAVAVAPGKDSGLPWDGPTRMPPRVEAALRQRAKPVLSGVFRALGASEPLTILVSLTPWLAEAFIAGAQAPDVSVDVYLNGRFLYRTPKVQDAYLPSWPNAYTPPIQLGASDQLEFRAIDTDLMNHDQIGTCISDGAPVLDAKRYATHHSFRCFGQLWGIALRVLPLHDPPTVDELCSNRPDMTYAECVSRMNRAAEEASRKMMEDPEFKRAMDDFNRQMDEAARQMDEAARRPGQ